MYDVNNPAATRAKSTGFVIPSNNEWVKAAYYDPKGGGTDSYWAYPTGPFKQPNIAVLNPGNGNVENASDQPLAAGDLQPERPEFQRGHPWCAAREGPDLVPVASRAVLWQSLPGQYAGWTRAPIAVHGEREHGRPGRDSLP